MGLSTETGTRAGKMPWRRRPASSCRTTIVGFAAAGTRARDLVDGARTLRMFGGYVPVRAEVADVPHFSTHADASQIIDSLCGAPAPHTTYLVHGDETAARTLHDRIDRELGWTAVVPRSGEDLVR